MKVPHFARKGDWFLWGILLSLLAVAGQARSLPQEVSRERLESHVRALSRLASRVPGYPGHEAATTYIRREFQVWGLRNVRWADLEVAVPVDEGAWLFVGEATSIRLYCLWPNLVRTPTLPPAGLTGPLLDGRAQGKRGGGLASSRRLRTGLSPLEGLAGREIEGSIVLLDFNCGQRWLELANLGAKALIFVEPATTWRGEAEQKFLDVPLNVPRFYLTRAGFRRLQEALQQQEGPATVRLLARMPWRRVKATNVWGYVRGTHAVRRREVICLQAYYDSMSVVPARAPGAESACGIAALLELARLFSRYPPQRTVLFLATTAHHLNNEGLRQWLEQHLAGGQEGEETGRERVRVDFLAALDLSSHGTQLGAFGVLGPQALPRVTGTINLHLTPYGRNFAAIGRAVAAELGLDPERAFIDGLTPPGGKPSDSFIPGRIALDSVAALTKGLTSLGLVTTNDGRWLVDTPLDTAERVNFAQLTQQVRVLAGLFDRALNAEELLVDTEVTINDETATLKGKVVYFNPRENFVPAEPIPGALALFQYGRPKTMMGVRGITIALTDEEGRYELVETLRRTGTVQAFKLDDTPLGGEGAGEIIYAPDRGVHGDQAFPMQVRLDAREKEHTIVLFPCLTTGLFELVDPQYLRRLDRLTVLNAADAVPVEYGFYIREGLAWTSLTEPVAAVFLKPGERFKVLAESGFLGKRMLLLNAPDATTKRRAEGLGYALETSQPLTLTPYCAARDMFQLDEYRLRNLHTFGIANDRVEAIHRQAGERLRQAAEARRQRQWSRFVTLSREAL
ncbi:MAG TPA: M28 family peptidase, partial [Armatimonadetes bacterium]|nr:M28 family peptidase [Armatimonadota bacterium]